MNIEIEMAHFTTISITYIVNILHIKQKLKKK